MNCQLRRTVAGASCSPRASLQGPAWLVVAQILNVVVTLARYAIISHLLQTVEAFGAFGLSRSFTVVFAFIGDMGIRFVLVSEIAARPEQALTSYRTAQTLRLMLSIASLPLLAAVAVIGGHQTGWLPMFAAGLVALTQASSDMPSAVLLGCRRMRLAAVISLLDGILGTVGVWIAMSISPTVLSAYLGMLAGNLLRTAVSTVMARVTMLPTILPGWSTPTAKNLMMRALPVGASLILFSFYGRIGFFVMSWKDSPLTEIGLLTTAITITSLLIFVPVTCSSVILPIFSSLCANNRETARKFHEGTLSAVLLCGLCASAVLVGTVDPMLKFLLGPEFVAAGPIVIIMAASLPLGFMSYVYKCMLVPLKREKFDLMATFVGIVVHFGVAMLLTDRYGTLGVAVAYLLAEIVVFGVKFFAITSCLGPVSFVQTLMKPALCGAAVYAAGYGLRHLEIPWILRPAGVLATLIFLVVVTRPVGVDLLQTFRASVLEWTKTSMATHS